MGSTQLECSVVQPTYSPKTGGTQVGATLWVDGFSLPNRDFLVQSGPELSKGHSWSRSDYGLHAAPADKTSPYLFNFCFTHLFTSSFPKLLRSHFFSDQNSDSLFMIINSDSESYLWW